MNPITVQSSRAVPVPLETAFARTIALPLTQLFSRRYGAFPAIKSVTEAHADWDTVGQSRRINTTDGGSLVETLTEMTRPDHFSYQIGGIRGPMKPLVSGVTGKWTFETVGTGTRITWTWQITPRNGVAARLMPPLARMWQGYARQAFEELEKALLAN